MGLGMELSLPYPDIAVVNPTSIYGVSGPVIQNGDLRGDRDVEFLCPGFVRIGEQREGQLEFISKSGDLLRACRRAGEVTDEADMLLSILVIETGQLIGVILADEAFIFEEDVDGEGVCGGIQISHAKTQRRN